MVQKPDISRGPKLQWLRHDRLHDLIPCLVISSLCSCVTPHMLNYLFTSSSVMFHGEAPCFVSLTDLNVPISDFQIWMVSKPILSCFPCFGHCKIKFITPLLTGSNHAIPWTSPRGFHSHGGTPLSLDAYGCFFCKSMKKPSING